MGISLRFYVAEIVRHAGSDFRTIRLRPDYKDGANADWAKYTPSGLIELSVGNPAGLEQFDEWLNEGGKPHSIHITMERVPEDG